MRRHYNRRNETNIKLNPPAGIASDCQITDCNVHEIVRVKNAMPSVEHTLFITHHEWRFIAELRRAD